jgi:tetraacyldisaccharide 4'-kinase
MQQKFLETLWYGRHPLRWLLYPVSLVFQVITRLRRYYQVRFCQQSCAVPLIVVGNLSVGGAGKTPLVIALTHALLARGLRVGIVSRGYGAQTTVFPHEVSSDDAEALAGDEPTLLARRTGCPVVIAPDRMQAVHYLLNKYQSQIIISDDGLQHYRMGRAIEIAVIDGKRGLGNGLCLPAGPLRESEKRLRKVDFIVVNGGEREGAFRMDLRPGSLTRLRDETAVSMDTLHDVSVAAVAAIGRPQRFFETLTALGVAFTAYPFADHHRFQPEDLTLPEKSVVMTEKDAVKCRTFMTDTMYYLPVDAVLDKSFWDALWSHQQLKGF